MANIITSIRIICSILLLIFPVFSPVFYILYIIAGLSDILDGIVARKTKTTSEFGSKLDTVADFLLVIVCLIKIIPIMEISVQLIVWIIIIAIIKIINLISVYVLQKKFVVLHTIMNKITGVLLFIFPLTLKIIDLKYSGIVICVIATFAAIQEGYLIRRK